MAGKNRFLYDLFVRSGTYVLTNPSDANPSYPVENIRNIWTDCVYKEKVGQTNDVLIEITVPTAVSISCAAFFGLNLTASYETCKLQRYSSGWVDVANLTYSVTKSQAVATFTPVSTDRIRIVLKDTTNSGLIQLGTAIIGTYVELDHRFEHGASKDKDDIVATRYSKKGNISIVSGYQTSFYGVTYEVLSADEIKLEEVWDACGKRFPFAFIEDSNSQVSSMLYSRFVEKFGRSLTDDYYRTITLVWESLK